MKLLRRFRWWWNRSRHEAELAEELAAHEAMARADLVRSGVAPAEAGAIARRALGPATWMREEARSVWIWPRLERLAQDFRFAVRAARRSPAFTSGVVSVMALGIGAMTTVFSVVDGVLLKPLPYPGAERLVYFEHPGHSPPKFRDWQRQLGGVERWAAAWSERQDLIGGGRPERLTTARVSPDFFQVFAGRAAVGRVFTADDYAGDGSPVVLSHRFWRRRFGSDSAVVGRVLELGTRRVVVVGVLDRRFVEPDDIVARPTDVWQPLVYPPDIAENPNYMILNVAGRLRAGLSPDEFRRSLARAETTLFQLDPTVHGDEKGHPAPISVLPLRQAMGREMDRPLWILLGAVGLMLLIACANVVNLYLARGTDRARELAVRASLGAGRGRIMRQLVTESVVLGLVAGALGLVLARIGVGSLAVLYPGNMPRASEIAVNGRVALVAIAVSIVTATVAGLVPALLLDRGWIHQAIKGGAEGGRRRTRSRSGLVVAEVALALMLLVGAGLLFRSFLAIVRVDPGFEPDGLGVGGFVLGDRFDGERRLAFASALVARVRALPGVVDASIGVPAPMARFGESRCCWAHNRITLDDGRTVAQVVFIHPVGSRYFETLGATVRGGTVPGDEPVAPPYPVVVSTKLGTKLFAGQEPVGREFTVEPNRYRIVGVVAPLHHFGLDQEEDAEFFVPYRALGRNLDELHLLFRTRGDPAPLFPAIRAAASAIDPTVPTDDLWSMPVQVDRSLAQPRFYGLLMGGFGGLALLLASAGIYASMLYTVRQRNREMGIRAALGAGPRKITRMVLSQAARLALVGLALGGLAAIALTRLLRGILFGVAPDDPTAFVGAAVILSIAALVAAYLPARRAGRADPLSVLRAD
jgi:putative ABC transport system permease protein